MLTEDDWWAVEQPFTNKYVRACFLSMVQSQWEKTLYVWSLLSLAETLLSRTQKVVGPSPTWCEACLSQMVIVSQIDFWPCTFDISPVNLINLVINGRKYIVWYHVMIMYSISYIFIKVYFIFDITWSYKINHSARPFPSEILMIKHSHSMW